MKSLFVAFITALALTVSSFSAHAIQSCKITVRDADNKEIYSILYGRGDIVGGKEITKGSDCDRCRSGARNEGPTLCKDKGGDNYVIQCVKNSGKSKTWNADC